MGDENERDLESIGNAELEIRRAGSGPTLLYLHGQDGLVFCRAQLDALAEEFTVVAPSHPGWGRSPRTGRFRTLDDVAYTYLDLLDTLDGPVHLMGCSLGAWLALEIATKCDHQLASITLVSPVGIRVGEPTVRHYLDIYASPPAAVAEALYGDATGGPDHGQLSEQDFADLAAAQESATYFVWEPYLHNPTLLDRLHRIRTPTLVVSGARDQLVLADDHVDTIIGHVTGEADKLVIDGVGHRVEEQAPELVAEAVAKFCRNR